MKFEEKQFKNEEFHSSMMVYYVLPDGTVGCSCSIKEFKQIRDKYTGALLIIAPENAPVFFRKG